MPIMRILSFNKLRNSVTISSWDSLNVADTSPINVASTSGFSDMSAMNELRSRGSVGGFQMPMDSILLVQYAVLIIGLTYV